jgi:hypothetical protein
MVSSSSGAATRLLVVFAQIVDQQQVNALQPRHAAMR